MPTKARTTARAAAAHLHASISPAQFLLAEMRAALAKEDAAGKAVDADAAQTVTDRRCALADAFTHYAPDDGATALLALALIWDNADAIFDSLAPMDRDGKGATERTRLETMFRLACALAGWIARQTGADASAPEVAHYLRPPLTTAG
jgi:hypothetical protein